MGPKSAEPAKYPGCVAGIPEKNPGIHVHAHAPGKCPPGLASSLDFASDFAPDQLSDLGDLEHLVLETQGGGGKLERNRMELQTPSGFPGNFRKRKVLVAGNPRKGQTADLKSDKLKCAAAAWAQAKRNFELQLGLRTRSHSCLAFSRHSGPRLRRPVVS